MTSDEKEAIVTLFEHNQTRKEALYIALEASHRFALMKLPESKQKYELLEIMEAAIKYEHDWRIDETQEKLEKIGIPILVER